MQNKTGLTHPLMTFSVSELNKQVRNLLEVSFMTISVTGEVSNFSKPGSGHWYFSLKDDKAQVRCAMFRSANQRVKNPPANGTLVIVKARVSLYEGRGEFQLIVEKIESAGTGALLLAYEALKQKLTSEGLFALDKKKTLPVLPTRVGVITSPTGAAIRDILTVLEERFPAIAVVVFPVSVQGQQASAEIKQALELANHLAAINHDKCCDVVIIARGGGSLEDLWAFNDEKLIRTIAASVIPVISGVGHETDFTLCDLAADIRAPTPSAAAEKVSPDQFAYLRRLKEVRLRLIAAIQGRLAVSKLKSSQFSQRLIHPLKRMEDLMQRLDGAEQRLLRLTGLALGQRQKQLDQLKERIRRQHPGDLIPRRREAIARCQRQLSANMANLLSNEEQKLRRLTEVMHSVSPLATLSRGYSITTDASGEIIRSKDQVSAGDNLYTKLAEGEIVSSVVD